MIDLKKTVLHYQLIVEHNKYFDPTYTHPSEILSNVRPKDTTYKNIWSGIII